MEKKPSINKKLDYNTELLVIAMEECGEMIEACSKAIRCEEYENNDRLNEEVGDVLTMIELMKERGLVNTRDLNNRIQMKKLKLLQWSNLLKQERKYEKQDVRPTVTKKEDRYYIALMVSCYIHIWICYRYYDWVTIYTL